MSRSRLEQPEAVDVQIRWLILRDMDEVLEIDRSHVWPRWSEDQFALALRERNCIGCVVEDVHRIRGFMIYELHPKRLRIMKIAVRIDSLRQGIGSQMIDRLIDKLSQQRRQWLTVDVPERLLEAQLFFASHGFRAQQSGDHVSFQYRVGTPRRGQQ